jgi:hypothetical protein
MKYVTSFSLAGLGLAGSVAVVLCCNGAGLAYAPPIEASTSCADYLPVYTNCEAGSSTTAQASFCSADPTSSDPNVARIPDGGYPVGCQVQFYFDDNGGGCSGAQNPCTCLAGDAGGDDAQAPGHWSNCADAGQSLVQ